MRWVAGQYLLEGMLTKRWGLSLGSGFRNEEDISAVIIRRAGSYASLSLGACASETGYLGIWVQYEQKQEHGGSSRARVVAAGVAGWGWESRDQEPVPGSWEAGPHWS